MEYKSVYGGLNPSTPANLLVMDRWLSGLRQLSTKESYTNTVP